MNDREPRFGLEGIGVGDDSGDVFRLHFDYFLKSDNENIGGQYLVIFEVGDLT